MITAKEVDAWLWERNQTRVTREVFTKVETQLQRDLDRKIARVHPLPGNVLRYVELAPDRLEYGDNPQIMPSLELANLVTSEVLPQAQKSPALPWLEGHSASIHRLVIDIDHPVKVIPSTTPGHSHLYLDVEVSWRDALGVLDAMAAAGIVEPNYVAASRTRGYTAVRLPWIRKAARRVTA